MAQNSTHIEDGLKSACRVGLGAIGTGGKRDNGLVLCIDSLSYRFQRVAKHCGGINVRFNGYVHGSFPVKWSMLALGGEGAVRTSKFLEWILDGGAGRLLRHRVEDRYLCLGQ